MNRIVGKKWQRPLVKYRNSPFKASDVDSAKVARADAYHY